MTDKLRARPFGSGSRPSDQAPTGLVATRFDPSRLLTEIRSERVLLACASAKLIPGDVWGCGAEGHYAFLCGLAAMLKLPSEYLDRMIEEARKRSRWWEDNHPGSPISECCPVRVFGELGFADAIAMEARSGETAGLDPKDEGAGPQDIAQEHP